MMLPCGVTTMALYSVSSRGGVPALVSSRGAPLAPRKRAGAGRTDTTTFYPFISFDDNGINTRSTHVFGFQIAKTYVHKRLV